MDSSTILEVKNLNVKVGKDEILKDISFELKKGEILAVIGPNGAGKTTLLKTLLGEYEYSGKIKFKEGIKIGYVPQRFGYIKDIPMKVKEFFELKNVSLNDAAKILKELDLSEEILEKSIKDLSSGQFQRVLIAWVLASNPDLILFDEPMEGIDLKAQKSVYKCLYELKKKNISIILVTHDLDVVYKFVDKCLCVNKVEVCYGKPTSLNKETLQKLYGGEVKLYKHTHEF
jgi:zinc transport system ATP-binding protein